MKQKLFGISILFILLITVFFAVSLGYLHRHYSETAEAERAGQAAVAINEAAKLIERIQENPDNAKTANALETTLEELSSLYAKPAAVNIVTLLFAVACAVCILFVLVVFSFCYLRIIRPFNRLERFAGEIAKGNLDFPLEIRRKNMFGEFSWAFDFMRNELNSARESENNAKRENKALIAAISHDIKTPVASIRAYAEALSKHMDNTPERRERYLSVIIKKSDEVANLTNDLFIHALSDMEKLQLDIKPHNARTLLDEILDPFTAEYGNQLKITSHIPDVTVSSDEKRLAQVFENLLANAAKYAPGSGIEVSFGIEDEKLLCQVSDHGTGIPPGDIPFIWNRFYRGGNTLNVPGTGLGLYIVKYIIERCGGAVALDNSDKGLTVSFSLPIQKHFIS